MSEKDSPLPVRLRPKILDEFVGQTHILGEGKLLRRVILSQKFPPLIFYGPPGSGKTTLGFIISSRINAEFKYLNAAFSGVGEVKKILENAKKISKNENKKTILFIDEIHRFNRLQQEAFIPDTEAGTIIFIGATIYNPRYYLINSLISRSIIAEFKPLNEEEMSYILKRTLHDKEKGLGKLKIKITEDALSYIVLQASGDARKALTSLEIGALTTPSNEKDEIIIDLEVAKETIQKNISYDKKGGYHYDTISAFIKSIRGSDPDSAIYWLAKMLVGGEDIRFIARRLVILASEDIGNAYPFALVLAVSCFKAVESIGEPEARLVLAQVTLYLACCPKSNASCQALSSALQDINKQRTRSVPTHLKTDSKSYKYPHNYSVTDEDVGSYVKQEYGAKKKYYFPKSCGEEKRIKEFLRYLETLK